MCAECHNENALTCIHIFVPIFAFVRPRGCNITWQNEAIWQLLKGTHPLLLYYSTLNIDTLS